MINQTQFLEPSIQGALAYSEACCKLTTAAAVAAHRPQ